jgi:hypothetical protein
MRTLSGLSAQPGIFDAFEKGSGTEDLIVSSEFIDYTFYNGTNFPVDFLLPHQL